MGMRLWTSWIAAALPAVVGTAADAELVTEYSAGHADIGVAYEDGGALDLHYHFGGDAVLDGVTLGTDAEYEPEDVHVRVSDSLKVENAPLDQVGLGTGPGDAWVLPQNNIPDVPFPGFATEEVPLDFGNTHFILQGFSGPGEFSLWQTGFGFDIFWDTLDGIDATDQLTLAAGSHSHYAWGFTAPGVYTLDVLAQSANDPSVFDAGTLTFLVGDDTQIAPVPEPASILLMGLGALGMCGGTLVKRRRTQASA